MSPDVLIPAGAMLTFAGARREHGLDVEVILSQLTSLIIARSGGKGVFPMEKTCRRERTGIVCWERGQVSYLFDFPTILLCL